MKNGNYTWKALFNLLQNIIEIQSVQWNEILQSWNLCYIKFFRDQYKLDMKFYICMYIDKILIIFKKWWGVGYPKDYESLHPSDAPQVIILFHINTITRK